MPVDQKPFAAAVQGERAAPEQVAAAIIRRVASADGGLRDATPEQIGRTSVEHMSLAGLVIAPAGKIAALLEVERAARALLGSEEAMAAALDGDADRAAQFDPWPEADALVAALIEVAACERAGSARRGGGDRGRGEGGARMTWDGQPAGEMGAAIEAVIAAAWCAGRDAAAGVCADMSEDRRDIHPDSRTREADELLDAIRALSPPHDLLSTLRPGGAP